MQARELKAEWVPVKVCGSSEMLFWYLTALAPEDYARPEGVAAFCERWTDRTYLCVVREEDPMGAIERFAAAFHDYGVGRHLPELRRQVGLGHYRHEDTAKGRAHKGLLPNEPGSGGMSTWWRVCQDGDWWWVVMTVARK